MTKEDIVNVVWKNTELNKKKAIKIVDTIINKIKVGLTEHDKVKIGGFGVFEVRERKPRIGRNPKTKVEAKIKAGKTLKFKPSKLLKSKVAENVDPDKF